MAHNLTSAAPVMYWSFDFFKKRHSQNLVLALGASIRINTVFVPISLLFHLTPDSQDLVCVWSGRWWLLLIQLGLCLCYDGHLCVLDVWQWCWSLNIKGYHYKLTTDAVYHMNAFDDWIVYQLQRYWFDRCAMYIRMILPRYGLTGVDHSQTIPGSVLVYINHNETIPGYGLAYIHHSQTIPGAHFDYDVHLPSRTLGIVWREEWGCLLHRYDCHIIRKWLHITIIISIQQINYLIIYMGFK